MNTRRFGLPSLAAAALLLLAACGSEPDPSDAPAEAASAAPPAFGVSLDGDAQRKLGVDVAPLQAAQFEERVEGPGLVVDARSIVKVMSDLVAADAAARASEAARRRAERLFEAGTAVSQEVLESAQRQAAADAAQLDVARAQVAAAFGYGAPWLDAARRDAIVDRLAGGTAVVVRASFPGGLPGGVRDTLSLRRVGAQDSAPTWRAADIWLGPADPSVPGPVLFAYVEAADDLVAGERLVASVPTGTAFDGVLVPRSAVVIVGGAAWCYVVRDEDRFVRQSVDLDRPQDGGYFQSDGFEPRQRAVVAGAGLLLARETAGGEEAD